MTKGLVVGDRVGFATGGDACGLRVSRRVGNVVSRAETDRAETDGDGVSTGVGGGVFVTGCAAVFEHAYQAFLPVPGLEVVSRGAFGESLAGGANIVFRFEHAGLPLASTQAGSLVVVEDEIGLHYTAELDLTNPLSLGVVTEIERGNLSGASFQGQLVRVSQSVDEPFHRLDEISLDRGDVSVVTYGQNPVAATELVSRNNTETETDSDGDNDGGGGVPVVGGGWSVVDRMLLDMEIAAAEMRAPVGVR